MADSERSLPFCAAIAPKIPYFFRHAPQNFCI
jgi:hypothetical protein